MKNQRKKSDRSWMPQGAKRLGAVLAVSSMTLVMSAQSKVPIINLDLTNVTLTEIFDNIEKQSRFSILLKNDEVDINKKVSVSVKDKPLDEVLNSLLASQNLTCEIKDKHIVIVPASNQKNQKGNKSLIKGIVVDENGEPIMGATIIEEGTTNGTTTDLDGNFSMEATPSSSLKFSYIGFVSKVVKPGNNKDLRVVMQDNSKELDEVIVVGYGSNTKRSMISSVSSVDTKQMKNIPVSNITQGLAGRSPGLIVKANGGGLNQKSTISIRGGSTPLVVIDGVIRSYDDFTALAPEDIESLSILKDASATAVYGSRAANGILQITTRRGKDGTKPQIDYNYNLSFSQPGIMPDKLNSYERAYYRNEAARNDGTAVPFTEEDLMHYKNGTDPLGHPDTDWRRVVLRNFAPQQKHNIQLSGGSEINNFFVSLGRLDQGSLYRSGTHNLDRTNFRLNQTSKIQSVGLKVSSQIDGYIENYDHPFTSTASSPYGVFLAIQDQAPWMLAKNLHGMPYITNHNPFADTSKEAGYTKTKKNVANGLLALDWALPWVDGLHLKGNGNFRYIGEEQKDWRKDAPQYEWDSFEPQVGSIPQLYKKMATGYSYTLQFLADYTKTFGKHSISALGGYEATYGFASMIWASRDTYQFDIDQIGAGPESTMKNGGSESESGRAGFVGQAKYNYDNRYFVEGSIRYDGSDNFPKHKRWGTFYSGSLGWSVADEAFFETIREKNIFNTLKLRGSYGEVGLDNWDDPYNIGRFAYITSYSQNGESYVIGNVMQPGFSEGSIPSPDITWFTTKQVDIGVDFSSLNNQLYGSVDYFYYQTKGFLYQPDQLTTGYVDPLGMALPKVSTDGEHRRAGWEFQLGYRNTIGKVEYNVSANYTMFDQLWANNPHESLESKKNPYKRTTQQKGYWGVGYKNLGYYTSPEDVYNSVKRTNSTNLVAGDVKYYDFNGDGVIDGQDQIRIGKDGFPRGNYGINLGVRYKGFSVNVLFQGATRYDMELGGAVKMNAGNTGTTPIYDFQRDYWTPGNTNAMFPRLVSAASVNGNNNQVTSDFWLVNGAYFRLKDVQLMYDFKNTLLRKVNWLSTLNIALTGQNIFTISEATKYGLDPENASTNNYAYPMERTIGMSVNIGF